MMLNILIFFVNIRMYIWISMDIKKLYTGTHIMNTSTDMETRTWRIFIQRVGY